jgi:hypothetical protein
MKSAQEAILVCSMRIKSFVHSHILKTDLNEFGQNGKVQITLTYQSKTFEFIVPFNRPFLNEPRHLFADLIYLNQEGNIINLDFQEFIIKITEQFSVGTVIEIPCKVLLISQGGNGLSDEPEPIILPSNPPKPTLSSASNENEIINLDDSTTHFIAFSDIREDSFCNQKLSKYFKKEKIKQLILEVNNSQECGNTFTKNQIAPFLTLIPIYIEDKGTNSESDYLKRVFADVIISQNKYLKRPNICLVYSEIGFANKDLFIKEWNNTIKLLHFGGLCYFFTD